MKRLVFALGLAFACYARAGVARAEDAAWREAAALQKQGYDLAQQAKATGDVSKYEAALEMFLKAYSLVHRAKPLFNAALAEHDLHRAPDAVHHFREFLRLPDADPGRIQRA